jgi:hypothetical protein
LRFTQELPGEFGEVTAQSFLGKRQQIGLDVDAPSICGDGRCRIRRDASISASARARRL